MRGAIRASVISPGDDISRVCAAAPFLTGNIKRESPVAVWGNDHEDDGDEEESGEVWALSYVFTHAAESGLRGASPLRVLTPGNALVMEKKKKKKKRRRGSASRRTLRRARGETATWPPCVMLKERAKVSFSALLCRYGAHVRAPTPAAPVVDVHIRKGPGNAR